MGFVSAGQSLTLIPPDRGGRQLAKILESLAILRAVGTLPLWGLIDIQVQHLARGSTIVVITHSVEEEVVLIVDFLSRRGLRPVIVLIDPASFNGPVGTEEIAEGLGLMKIRLRVVHNGDDLSKTLSLGG